MKHISNIPFGMCVRSLVDMTFFQRGFILIKVHKILSNQFGCFQVGLPENEP